MKSPIEALFPNITRSIKESGTVEIGYDPTRSPLTRR